MEGSSTIDKKTIQWVKVEATVIRPVSIAGFLAQVQPGTRFELEKMPVTDSIWLPEHFAMKSQARVLFLFTRKSQDDESYFGYHKASPIHAAVADKVSASHQVAPTLVRSSSRFGKAGDENARHTGGHQAWPSTSGRTPSEAPFSTAMPVNKQLSVMQQLSVKSKQLGQDFTIYCSFAYSAWLPSGWGCRGRRLSGG